MNRKKFMAYCDDNPTVAQNTLNTLMSSVQGSSDTLDRKAYFKARSTYAWIAGKLNHAAAGAIEVTAEEKRRRAAEAEILNKK